LPDSLATGGFRLDLYEDDENYHAVAELPGVAKSDLTVQLDNGVLTIGAERVRKDDTGKKFKLSRTISVTEDVEPGKVSAKYEDGILIVALPKAEARKPRSIQVN
jgi:HSP20 family protein